ncbi:hypothetical protein PUNSTDRAFT_114838 [Punctularia strigosozonata HHB-11173 SS5]|uniref:uncharacterized protein n=1 Tax=Punctularia strigosozonata (strain HHB-11173) TaxID=741275 RepID=UPI00044174E2|nr:uncharacterized protein PUNSTDRAFT_114838 [Punctularia strigosozonata HHB-11173 SS5]EIN07392.1 hypothetical protein PUNSTDRAFT_114838 [Punctularia strigosozonata HHB-11173 SS5]
MDPERRLTILRDYAKRPDPESLRNSIRFSHTETTLTVFDRYPKSIFHFLVLPRILPRESRPTGLRTAHLDNLRSLLSADRECAKAVLLALKRDVQPLKAAIEQEMLDRYGCTWPIWIGFHPISSMLHLHLHVLSADLCEKGMKTKKHYNSFHPKIGYFLPLEEVLSWFDGVPSYFESKARLLQSDYQDLLNEDLTCFRCRAEFTTMPKLIEHLKQEFAEETEKKRTRRKRYSEIRDRIGSSSKPRE